MLLTSGFCIHRFNLRLTVEYLTTIVYIPLIQTKARKKRKGKKKDYQGKTKVFWRKKRKGKKKEGQGKA